MGTDAPLYYLACKCRDSALRHRAAQLMLGSRRREGFWDGHITGQFVQRIIALEEDGASGSGPYFTCDQIPESSRFSDITLGVSEDGTRGRLYLGRFKHESTGEWVVHETEFDLNHVKWEPVPVTNSGPPRGEPCPTIRLPTPELKFTASFDVFQDQADWHDPRMPSALPMKHWTLSGFPIPSAAGVEAVRRQNIVERAQAAKDRLRAGWSTAGEDSGSSVASFQEGFSERPGENDTGSEHS